MPKNWKRGPFWVLHIKVEAFGCVENQVLSTFGKNESFTTSGTYAMSEKSDEKKLATVKVGLFSLEKRRLKSATVTVGHKKVSSAANIYIQITFESSLLFETDNLIS